MPLKSMREAAAELGISTCTTRRLAAKGLVRTVTVGRRRLVSEVEINRIVAAGVPDWCHTERDSHIRDEKVS